LYFQDIVLMPHMKLICALWTVAMASAAGQTPAANRGLSARLPQFTEADQSFEEALRELARRSGDQFVICFEPSAESGAGAPRLHLNLENVTVGEALARKRWRNHDDQRVSAADFDSA
jgi:hypothetical protein